MRSNKTYRILVDKFYLGLICLLSFLALIPFISIIYKLVRNGIYHLNINLFTQVAPPQAEILWAHMEDSITPGGILHGILGTFYILFIALIIVVPLSILTALYLHDNWNNKFTLVLRYAISILNGIPSVIVGIVVYLWIAKPIHSHSALAGGIALAIIMYPIMVGYTKGVLWKIPQSLRDCGFALGLSYYDLIFRIILPHAKGGIIAGILHTVSRAIGITTPLIITALGTSLVNWDLLKPTTTLSMLIWKFFNTPNLIDFMWSTALLLLILIMLFNGIAKYIHWKWEKSI